MHVLISGAGIAGPTLAWFLAKTGVQVTIIEKSKGLFPHGQNVDIQGSAVEVVRRMGLLEEVRKRNTTEKGAQFIGSDGTPFASFPLTDGLAASPTSPFEIMRGDLPSSASVILQRSSQSVRDLGSLFYPFNVPSILGRREQSADSVIIRAAILHEATKDQSGVRYLFDTSIKDVIANENDSVMVELTNGDKQRYDILVAADGQWSKVRQQSFPPASIQVRHTGMYAAYYTIPRLPNDNQLWNVFVGLKSRVVTTRPDPYGTTRAMLTIMPRSASQEVRWRESSRKGRKIQSELLKEEFADAGWQTRRLLDAMDAAPDFYFQVIEQIKMSKWSEERVVCLGDAAWAPTPLTGMGTSLAILGAYVLAGELSKVQDGEHPSKALKTYEDKFRPFVEESQTIFPFVPAIMHPARAWKRWVLRSFITAISKIVAIPWVANRMQDPSSVVDFPLPDYGTLTST